MIVGGSVQVCDFGLARMMGSDRATTAAGSIAYAAPECLIENKPSFSTDQYSLAITYYELKTGKLPYQEDSLAAILDAKREANAGFLRSARCGTGRAEARDAAQSGRALCLVPRDDRGPPGRNVRRGPAPCRGSTEILAPLGSRFPGPGRCGRGSVVRLVAALAFRPTRGHRAHPESDPAPTPSPGPRLRRPTPIRRRAAIGRRSCSQEVGKDSEAVVKMAKPTWNAALQALRNQDFAAAVPDLEQAAKFMPNEAKVFSRLGAAWSGQNRWDRAVESYTTAIQIEHHPLDYQARGQAYLKLGRVDDAIADFHQSVKLDPKNAKAYAELCDIYLDKDDPQRAIQEISKAVQICQDDPKANFREFSARLPPRLRLPRARQERRRGCRFGAGFRLGPVGSRSSQQP